MGVKNLYICSVFRRLRHLIENIFWTKRDIDNRSRALESTKGLLHCPKFHELWSTNGSKRDRIFTHPHYFVSSQSIAHPLSLIGINVAPGTEQNSEDGQKVRSRFKPFVDQSSWNFGQCRRPFVLSSALVRLSMSCFILKIFAFKCRSCRKPEQM